MAEKLAPVRKEIEVTIAIEVVEKKSLSLEPGTGSLAE